MVDGITGSEIAISSQMFWDTKAPFIEASIDRLHFAFSIKLK